MDKSVPSSPSPYHGQQDAGSHDERMQPTPPNAFQFSGVPLPATAQQHQPNYPMQAHVLVDPVTGQHYIVPQAYYPPIQPMYYPPPGSQPHPMMYQYPKQPVPQTQPMYMGMPMYNMPPATSRSDSVSTSGEREHKEDNEVIQGGDDTMSTTSSLRNSFSLMQNPKIPQFGTQRENSREYMYRSPSGNPEAEFPMRSPMAQPKFDIKQRLEGDTRATQSDFEGKAPLNRFTDRMANSSASDVETSRRERPEQLTASRDEIEQEKMVETKKKPFVPPSKSIRMEINFDDVPSMPTDPKPARRSNATAFTVNLDETEKDVSLQEAARNLAESRRKVKLGKNLSLEKIEKPEALPNSKTNKNFLLEKLLTGKTSGNVINHNDESPDAEGSEVGSIATRDFDARSEALTFVVDTSKRPTPNYYAHNQFQSRVVQYSDDESSSDSEIMEQFSQRSQPQPEKEKVEPPKTEPTKVVNEPTTRPSALPQPSPSLPVPQSYQPSTSKPTTPRTTFDRSNGSGTTSDFLQELAKLRIMAGLPASGIGGSEPESRNPQQQFRRAVVSSARAPTMSSSQKAVPPRSSFNSRSRDSGKETVTTPTSSRRSETRRSVGGNASPQLSGTNRPPFRTGAQRGIMIGQSEQQREQERTAWLRRKDYNPMKAAAAGRKNSDQKNREQQFTSRRSMTFHSTNDPFAKIPIHELTRPARNRSQEPRDPHNEKYRMMQRRRVEEPKLSGLAKAVDMLSLKCKKSIELIRQQNKGCLSVSVEDLLSAAAEPPRPSESLDEQLERLSDAFDAVQRYLEQYSLDGNTSPVPDSFYDDDAVESNSTFSGVSTHRNQESESISSSYRRKVLDS